MAWRQRVTDCLADILRFAIHGALLVNGIAVAVASVFVVVQACWFFLRFLNRTIFSEPW